MITWMQRHKKWLVITIWISTIAFVGAGFVGWGSYDMGSTGGKIGSVGDKEIEVRDVQNEYSKLYNQYEQMFGASFNNEMAKKLNLQSLAYNNVIQKYLLLNLADEYGLEATDKEIAKALVQYEAFLKDGKFNKEQYIKALKTNRTNPSAFEEDLKKNINIQKLTQVLSQEVNQNALNDIAKLFFAEDKIAISIIKSDDIKLNYNNSDIKQFFEKNKENYKTIKQYKLLAKSIAFNEEDKKASKKEALKAYLNAKKGKIKLENTIYVDETTTNFNQEDLTKIFKAKNGDFIKPIKTNNSYVVLQLIETIEPQIQKFEAVKTKVKDDFLSQLKQKQLNLLKEQQIKNFNGKEIGYVSKNLNTPIKGLSKEETSKFVNELFNSKEQISSVDFDNKIVVFKILDSRLAKSSKDAHYLKENINQILNNEIFTSLIKQLELKYKIDSRM